MKKILLIIIFYAIIILPQSIKMIYLFENSLEPDTKEYQRLVDSVGGSISATDLDAINTFVKETKSIRGKIIRFNPFAGDNLTTALVPLFRGDSVGKVYGHATDVKMFFVNGDYARTTGLGDVTNSIKYVKTGVNPSNISFVGQNDITFGSYALTDTACDCEDGTSNVALTINPRLNTNARYRINAGNKDVVSSSSLGLFIASRTSSANWVLSANGSQSTLTQTSTGEGDLIALFARGEGGGSKNKRKLSGYIIGKGLTSAELTTLHNAWVKLKTAFGR